MKGNHNMKRTYFAAVLMAAAAFTTSAYAQNYGIDWFTIDGQ